MNYNYDESGLYFYYFLVTILALIVVPYTLKTVRYFTSKVPKCGFVCSCEACNTKDSLLKSKKKSLFSHKRLYFLVFGWAAIAVLARFIIRNTLIEKIAFDPFEILGIEYGTSEKDIKKAFRKLSLLYHPDKATDLPKEKVEDRFVRITKAYKVLTDEVSRLNYEKYGNADGVDTNEIGIALPSWLVDGKNLPIVLGFYIFAFMIAMPYFIGKWWNSSSKYTKDKIMHLTMALYYRDLKENMTFKKIIELLSASAEFKDELPWRPTDNAAVSSFFNRIRQDIDAVKTGEKFDISDKYTAPYCVKAYCLLYAHMFRLPIEDANLLCDQQLIVQKSITLLDGMVQICVARDWVRLMQTIVTVQQSIVQALHDDSHQLTQLPFVSADVAKTFKQRKRNVKSLMDFLTLSSEDQITAMKHASDDEFKSILSVAYSFPVVEMVSVTAKVLGYDKIIPGSIITLTVKLAVTSLNKKNDETATLADSPKEAAAHDDEGENVLLDEEGNIIDEGVTAKGPLLSRSASAAASPPPIHAPFFPQARTCGWWVFVASKNNNFIVSPTKVTGISEHEPRTVTFNFPSPSQPTTFTLMVHVKCDSIVGLDTMKEITVKVVESDKRMTSQRTLAQEYDGLTDDEADTDVLNL